MKLKARVKSLLSHLHVHEKTMPDIFVLTLPRSGSTLLTELLNLDARVKMVSEPFSLHSDNRVVLEFYFDKYFLTERYVDLNSEELAEVYRYLNALSQGETWNAYYWTDLLKKSHQFRTQRTVFKIHKLCYQFGEVAAHFKDDYVLYLLRHPVAHSLSRLHIGWATYIDEHLKTQKVGRLLSSVARKRIDQILQAGSELEKMVLSWYLENYRFLIALNNETLPDNTIPVLYEDLVSQPEKTLRSICAKVQMEYNPKMLNLFRNPSSGIIHSKKETAEQIKNQNVDYLINRWKTEQSEIDEAYLLELQEDLGLSGLILW